MQWSLREHNIIMITDWTSRTYLACLSEFETRPNDPACLELKVDPAYGLVPRPHPEGCGLGTRGSECSIA